MRVIITPRPPELAPPEPLLGYRLAGLWCQCECPVRPLFHFFGGLGNL